MKSKFIYFVITIILINTILGLYYRPCGWIERKYGATTAIWNPGEYLIQGLEGFGIYKVDGRGYLNPEFEPDEIEYLTVGSSHTLGKEVWFGNRYTDILNVKFGEKKFYSVAQDAFFFPKIAKGFTALISEFPNTNGIIIEIGNTEFTNIELQSALEQRKFKEEECGDNILKSKSSLYKFKLKIKEYTPLLSIIKKQLQLVEMNQKTESTEKENVNLLEYENNLNRVLKQMREVYQEKIIVVYHPTVSFQKK